MQIDLLKAINHKLSGNELKIMLAYAQCREEKLDTSDIEFMLQLSGVTDRANYYKARRKLIDKKYLRKANGKYYINTKELLEEEEK